MIKAVILDLDDTLVLTKEAAFEGDNELLRRLGYPPVSKELHDKHWGKYVEDSMQHWAPGLDITKFRDAYTQLIAEYVKAGKLDVIPPENLKALDQLVKTGKTLYVLTSRAHNEVLHILEPDHYLARRIHAFYYRDNMQFHKPDPRAFAQIEREHGWKPQECVYVGDSVSDAVAAKGAGLHFIASLESGLRTKDDFADYPVDVFINVFPEVVAAVRSLESAAKS